MAVSERQMQKVEAEKERLRRTLAKVKKEGQVAVQAGIRTGAGMASAFGVAYTEQRYPDKAKVFGIDLSLLVGVTGTAVGAFGLAGDRQTNDIVEAIGNGALFAFAAKRGGEMGSDARTKA